MKLVVLPMVLLLGLKAALPARAQQAGAPLASLPRLTHADSVAVLHQLFQHERRFGRIGTLADALVLPANVTGLASGQGTDFQRGLQVFNVAAFSPLLVSSIVQWVRFSQRREREAVQRFEQRQVQSLYVQRSYALALIARTNQHP